MRKTLKELAQAAGGIAWSWWTSNSLLRLTSEGSRSLDGDVLSAYRAADGVPNICCVSPYREYIEAASPEAVLNLHAELDRVTVERDALQQRLTISDQRNDDATDLLRRCRAVVEGTGWVDLERDIVAFLKPAFCDCNQGRLPCTCKGNQAKVIDQQ